MHHHAAALPTSHSPSSVASNTSSPGTQLGAERNATPSLIGSPTKDRSTVNINGFSGESFDATVSGETISSSRMTPSTNAFYAYGRIAGHQTINDYQEYKHFSEDTHRIAETRVQSYRHHDKLARARSAQEVNGVLPRHQFCRQTSQPECIGSSPINCDTGQFPRLSEFAQKERTHDVPLHPVQPFACKNQRNFSTQFIMPIAYSSAQELDYFSSCPAMNIEKSMPIDYSLASYSGNAVAETNTRAMYEKNQSNPLMPHGHIHRLTHL